MGEIMFRYFRKRQGPKQAPSSGRGGKPSVCAHARDGYSKHVGLKFETLESRWLLDGTMLQISEFMADNAKTLADGNGKYSDWIEIYNPNANAVNLEGWHLTDNASKPTKWPCPDVTIAAGGYFVVFATGESTVDYVDPAGYYHTNFKIDKEGEYLGLYRPDGTVACDYAPQFPQQITDISYGIGAQTTTTSLVATGAGAKILGAHRGQRRQRARNDLARGRRQRAFRRRLLDERHDRRRLLRHYNPDCIVESNAPAQRRLFLGHRDRHFRRGPQRHERQRQRVLGRFVRRYFDRTAPAQRRDAIQRRRKRPDDRGPGPGLL